MKKILIITILLYLLSCSSNNKENIISINRDGNIIKIVNYASCSLKLYTQASQNTTNNNILEVKNGINKNSLNINFYDLNTDKPYMESNGGKADLTKIDNGLQIYLIEKTGVGNIIIYTLFKDKGILIMSKQYDLLGAFGYQMIGYCN